MTLARPEPTRAHTTGRTGYPVTRAHHTTGTAPVGTALSAEPVAIPRDAPHRRHVTTQTFTPWPGPPGHPTSSSADLPVHLSPAQNYPFWPATARGEVEAGDAWPAGDGRVVLTFPGSVFDLVLLGEPNGLRSRRGGHDGDRRRVIGRTSRASPRRQTSRGLPAHCCGREVDDGNGWGAGMPGTDTLDRPVSSRTGRTAALSPAARRQRQGRLMRVARVGRRGP